MNVKQLHIISTGKQSLADFIRIAREVHPFVTAFHLREKSRSALELWQCIETLQLEGVPPRKIIVNDRVDVAAAARVGGVQLAYHSLPVSEVKRLFPNMLVGKSVHSEQEAEVAAEFGSDYLLFGHIYATQSKLNVPTRGITALRQVVASVPVPVIAIGGILPDHVPELVEAGATGIAVMSGVMDADEPVNAVKAYAQALR